MLEKQSRAGGVAQGAECLPSLHNALHSISGIAENQAWWYTPMTVLYIQRWMQEDQKSKAILGYRVGGQPWLQETLRTMIAQLRVECPASTRIFSWFFSQFSLKVSSPWLTSFQFREIGTLFKSLGICGNRRKTPYT